MLYKGHTIEPFKGVQIGYETRKGRRNGSRKIKGYLLTQPDGYNRHFDTLSLAKTWADRNPADGSEPAPDEPETL
jgi:hypothetical protein